MTQKRLAWWSAGICATVFAVGCAQTTTYSDESAGRDLASTPGRGSPGQYDPGPEKGSEWAKLFASTPNYRGIGDSVIGGSGEKFRWQFGPMWYRGRLGENEVKVFVVGQEGAQDENVSNRAFTGSTGTKTQNFLNTMGIRHSYLFLNTFVYTINGQLSSDPKFKWLEQGKGSPIVEYRHKLFDQMAKTNKDSLALLMGVGSGGKASLMSWIKYNGGDCRSYNPESCDLSAIERKFGLKKKLRAIGVPHPGGANPSLGGTAQLQKVIKGFERAAKYVADEAQKDPSWMPVDSMNIDGSGGKATRSSSFRYKNAVVPHWDFAYGTNWRMGKSGTSSNRQGADSIQVFSDDGQYNPPRNLHKYDRLTDVNPPSGGKLPEMMDYNADGGTFVGDLPYESPKFIPNKSERASWYDYGPCDGTANSCDMSELLQGQVSGYNWPNFKSLGVTSHESFGAGPIYRGRLKKAKLLVVADQMDHDDFFSARALTGDAGQKLQTFLYALGLTESYAILRTAPVDTLDLDDAARERVLLDAQVSKVRGRIIQDVMKASGTEVVISFGRFAKKAVDAMKLSGVEVYNLVETSDARHAAQWNEVHARVKAKLRGDVQPLASYNGKNSTINRIDMPVHTRWWMGTSGNRARRPTNNTTRKLDPDHYMVTAPEWVKKLRPIPARLNAPATMELFYDSSGSGESNDEDTTE
jgi:uracil-DNA glycosylase